MQQNIINQIFSIFNQSDPNPQTELDFGNHFQLLIAIVLSAQATDVSVNKATKNLFKIAHAPEDILNLGEENLKQHIKTIGLWNSKAKNILQLCKILVTEHNSTIPPDFDKLISLPGVGRKTANVWLNCALKTPTIAVDTHVGRVARRLGISSHTNPDHVEKDLLKKIPEKWHQTAHHHMILHGRYVCKSQKPLCGKCVIKDLCPFEPKYS